MNQAFNKRMNQLILLFADIIRRNNYMTFAYSTLDDQWFYLEGKHGEEYDLFENVESLQFAYEKLIEECHYYWLNKNNLLDKDSSIRDTVSSLQPEAHSLLEAFLRPYVQKAVEIMEEDS